MQDAVELLLKRAAEIEQAATSKFERVSLSAKEERDKQIAEANNLQRAAREICTHPRIREEDDYDYHNGIHWTEQHCDVCGKYLGRH